MRTMGSSLTTAVVAALSLAIAAGASAQDIAVRAERLYTVDGAPIDNGVVVVRDGRIRAVGPADQVRIPDGIDVIEAAVATPGLIDAHTVVGLAGYFNQPTDQDQLERSEAIQPELRAIDAYNTRETLVRWLREHGVTTIHTGHAPGEIVSGQTMIAKTAGDTIDRVVMTPAAMLAATLGEGVVITADGARKSPGTRSKAVAMLRAELVRARDYARNRDTAADDERPARDLRLEALAAVLAGDRPMLVTAHRHHDIVSALRIAEEFDIRIVLDGGAEAYLVADEIAAAGVDVIIHPAMTRAWAEKENLSFLTAGQLLDQGIRVAFQSGYESYVPKTRVVLFEAAINVQYGLETESALRAMTLGAAEILGIDDRVGSLSRGKDGDVALFDGDPFEYTTHVIGTIVDGRLVSSTRR